MTTPWLRLLPARPVPGDGDDDAPPSLVLAESHWWGTLRAADGWTTCPARSALHLATKGRRLLLNVGRDDRGLQLSPAGATTGPGAPVESTVGGECVEHRGPDGSWNVETCAGSLHWKDGDVVDVEGRRFGSPAEWSRPGIRYRLHVYEVGGRVLGHDVTGFVGFDQIHLPPGEAFYRDDPVARGGSLVAMFSFANRYADGSFESGSFAVGHEGWRYAFVQRSDGDPVVTDDVGATVTRADGYWPTRIDVSIAGEDWVWEGGPAGRFTGYGRLDNPQCDGRFHRAGDRRTPVMWFAQGETVPGHGDTVRRS